MSTATAVLPSGPLRLASSSKPTNTFSLRYPASHPPDLSTAGAALSSTASGDVSLRMAPGAQPSETRGRRWAGRQTRPTGDVECVIVWDSTQNSWILHRVENLVQLASDDPEPIPRKPIPAVQPPPKPAPLALPKPARPPPQPTPAISHSQPAKVDPQPTPQTAAVASRQPKAPSVADPIVRLPAKPAAGSQQHSNSSSSSTSPAEPGHNRTNLPAPPETRPGLALPSKKPGGISSAHQTTAQRLHQRSNTASTMSSPGEQGPIPVVQAEEIEEFDFVDSPPDALPNQPIIAPSPTTLPSPAPPTTHIRQPRVGLSSGLNFGTAQHPNLSRSPSLAESHAAGTTGSPLGRSNGLTLPTRSSAARPTVPAAAAHNLGVRASAQPVAHSPLQSVAYSSSSSSPNDLGLTAPTPLIITPASAASSRPALGPGRSPAPAWHTHHLQHPSNPNSPYTVPSSSATAPTRTYQRSDSGSSVRESDTDSDESSSEEEEEDMEPVVPAVPTGAQSEQDAEADSDSDGEEDLDNFASELEAQMQMSQEEPPVFTEPEKSVPNVVVAGKTKAKKKVSSLSTSAGGRRGSSSGKGKGVKGGGVKV